jgi:hypothetical protein
LSEGDVGALSVEGARARGRVVFGPRTRGESVEDESGSGSVKDPHHLALGARVRGVRVPGAGRRACHADSCLKPWEGVDSDGEVGDPHRLAFGVRADGRASCC